MSAAERSLAARLLTELEDVGQVADRVIHLAEKASQRADPDYLDGAALNLHGFYAGVERMLERIANEVDGTVPAGPECHRDLLVQMSSELPRRRPAVISRETRDCLDEYRGFRHVVRNVYTFQLRPDRVMQLTEGLTHCRRAVVKDVQAFCSFLTALDDG